MLVMTLSGPHLWSIRDPAAPQMFRGEAEGLEALRGATELLKVPQVLHVGNCRDGADVVKKRVFFGFLGPWAM